MDSELSISQIQHIKIEDLLERETISINNKLVKQFITDKKVLITGAAGSIGSELVRQLIKFSPNKLILLDQAVFQQQRVRSNFIGKAYHFAPEAGAWAVNAELLAVAYADVLAGKPPADDVDKGKRSGCSDVVIARCLRPVFREHTSTERIALDLPDGARTKRTLEAKLEAADAAEEGSDRQHQKGFA